MDVERMTKNLKSDHELLRAWEQTRDEDAIRHLIERHSDLLTRVAQRRLLECDMAPDVAGKAFALMAARPNRVPKGEVSGWLVQVTMHLCNTENRAHRRRLVNETAALKERTRNQTLMNRNLDTRTVEIDDLLQKLNAEDRECLLLHAAEGLSHREVGQRLGVSENAARMRTTRAIERLRQKLGLSASAMLPALERIRVEPFSPSDRSRTLAWARAAPPVTIGSLPLTWILMTNIQRLALTTVAGLLVLGGTSAAIKIQQSTKKTVIEYTKPEAAGFEGKWKGSFTYLIRRTNKPVTLQTSTEISRTPEGFRMKVAYSEESNWAVDAGIQVNPNSKLLVYTDKGDRQVFTLTNSSRDRFSGERFVDEPGRPRNERLTFSRQGNNLSVLIEERLESGGWIFANEQRLVRPN